MRSTTFLFILYFAILTLAIPLKGQAQSSRPPNAAEIITIQKAIDVVNPFIDSFVDNNWGKLEGGADGIQNLSIQKNPDVVMGVAPFNAWLFRVNPGSDYFDRAIKPLMDKIPEADLSNASAAKVMEYSKTAQQLTKFEDVFVEVFVNQKNLPEKLSLGMSGDLNIAGSAYAYHEKPETEIPTMREGINSYIIAFGNWSSSKLDKNLKVYQFQFTHPLGTPFIENIVIKISGNQERIMQLLKTANWKVLNNALTK